MKKLWPIILFLILVNACREPEKKLSTEFREPENPEKADSSLWNQVISGLHAGFASVDSRYARDLPPGIQTSGNWNVTSWRGEMIHTQFLLWSVQDIPDIGWKFGEIKNNQGEILDSNTFDIRAVRYVLTDEFAGGCGYRSADTIPSHLVGDMLERITKINLLAHNTRPLWLTVSIPENQPPGVYNGKIKLIYQGDSSKVLNFSINIQDQILPPPSDWAFHLDLWQNPFAVARFHKIPLWSQDHWDLLKPLLTLLANAGQKCITTSIIPFPWGKQTYDPIESMIGWIHNSSGKWVYDYSIFDQYVQFAMDCGITEQINCYSMVPWGNLLKYFDEDSSGFVTRKVVPGSEEFEELWKPFLYDFRAHLKEMGWLEKTTLAMDERNMKEMKATIALLKKVVPEFRVTMAGHYFEDINPALYDFSYNWGFIKKNSKTVAEKRRRNDQITTYYVACGIPRPNNFTFSPPAESAYEGWFAAAMGFDGFLRWAYNSWVENPLMDTRFRKWPAGDTYFVYPGARSSIRFERLREGIQDYEKIRILRNEFSMKGVPGYPEKLKELENYLEKIDPGSLETRPAKEWVNEGKKLIHKLSSK
jgi:hypothetical protein